MPSSIVVERNGHRMTFTEDDHSYVDENKARYVSVTQLIGAAFEKFDAEAIAKKKAARDGSDWQKLVLEWQKNGEKAANEGTRLHFNCEQQILGRYDNMLQPESINEKINFDLAKKAVDELKNDRTICNMTPEKLVFSPKLKLAGSIDLLCEKTDGTYIIYDWKNIKDLSTTGFKGKTGILKPVANLQDSNFWHYALQLQIYEIILKFERYVDRDAKFLRCLNVFMNGRMRTVELPDVMKEAKGLITLLIRGEIDEFLH